MVNIWSNFSVFGYELGLSENTRNACAVTFPSTHFCFHSWNSLSIYTDLTSNSDWYAHIWTATSLPHHDSWMHFAIFNGRYSIGCIYDNWLDMDFQFNCQLFLHRERSSLPTSRWQVSTITIHRRLTFQSYEENELHRRFMIIFHFIRQCGWESHRSSAR